MLRRFLNRAIKHDRIHIRSGFLALWCLEAVVPMLALVAAGAELLDARAELHDALQSTLHFSIFGTTHDAIGPWLGSVVTRASWQRVGLFGMLSALFVGYQLYVAVLFDLGELLCSGDSDRTWLTHFALYPVFVAWVILLLVGGLVGTTLVWTSGSWWLTPGVWIVSAAVLSVAPRMFGRAQLPWRALLMGSAVGATWLELLKAFFVAYSTSAYGSDALTTLYRDLAFVPLAMLWMHLLWFSVLLGAVVARVVADHDGDDEGISAKWSAT